MEKKIKILHVIYALSGGGAERQLQLLLKYSSPKSIHGVLCVDTRGIDCFSSDVQFFVHTRRGKFDLGIFLTCYKTIKMFQPNVVHVWLPPVITIPAMLMAASQGKKIIFSYRNRMSFIRYLSFFEYVVALFFSSKVISNNSVLQSTKYYRFLYKLKNGTTIPNGVDFSLIQKKVNSDFSKKNIVNMVFVGRLVKDKNILNLLMALELLPKNRLWKLDVFGEGDLKHEASELANQLGLSDRIVFHGFDKSIYLQLAKSDLLLMPSRKEGMPNVLLEALATKVPIVASDISSITDIVGRSGVVILIDPHKPTSIAKGILAYMDNQKSFIQNTCAGSKIAESYDAKLMSDRYQKEYVCLLRGNKSNSPYL